MAAANAAIRLQLPRKLTNIETADSLDHWIDTYVDYIQRDPILAPFLTCDWNYAADNMGFTVAAGGVEPAQRAANCKIFLSHVNSFLPNPYSRNAIAKRSTNVESIWTLLREKYNVTKSAETLLDIGNLKHDKTESYASFFQKVVYYIEMNLAPANITVDHVATGADGDELSVTLMDLAAIIWIQKIDPRLFDRIRVDYAVQIKNGSRLSELVPTIARALPGMIKSMDGVKKEVMSLISGMNLGHEEDDDSSDMNTQKIYKVTNSKFQPRQQGRQQGRFQDNKRGNKFNREQCKHCTWLKTFLKIKEVDTNHSTSSCTRALPTSVKSIIEGNQDDSPSETSEEDAEGEQSKLDYGYNGRDFQMPPKSKKRTQPTSPKAQDHVMKEKILHHNHDCHLSEKDIAKLKVRTLRLDRKASSPRILVTWKGDKFPLLLDEGSEIDCGDADYIMKKGMKICPTHHSATAAGNQNLTVLGVTEEDVIVDTKFNSIRVPINMGRITVVKDLGVPLLLGEPGKARNAISTDPKHRMVFLEQEKRFFSKPYHEKNEKTVEVCRIHSGPVTVYPEGKVTLEIPETFIDKKVVITPRREFADSFIPIFTTGNQNISLINKSYNLINIKKHSHLADVRTVEESEVPMKSALNLVHQHSDDDFKFKPRTKLEPPDLSEIKVDPDHIMSESMRRKFQEVNFKYRKVFSNTPGRYTGAFGDSDTSLRFNSRPIQTRKVQIPNYNPDMKQILSDKMTQLWDYGILARPEDLGISIEHYSPCLIVPKPGSNDWRLVTDLTELNLSITRDSSVSPTMEEAKSAISQRKYFCEADLTSYFHQGGLSRSDCQWLGVMHPHHGPLCYTSTPQGLKNASEQSYNRLAKIFGPMLEEGRMTRMADGLYPIADSLDELLINYTEMLERLEKSGLTLKPSKTTIAPKSAVIFGWRLQDGKWSPQEHTTSSLSRAEKPVTVKQLRSFNGSVKQLSETIPRYAELLHPLEQVIGSRSSSERIVWTPELEKAFAKVKEAVKSPEGIFVPRREDKLITSSDFSKTSGAIGGKLLILRKTDSGEEKKLFGGHFSAKVSEGKSRWLPCDGEALGVKQVLEHFQHHIRESRHECVHYTDSMPVVQAYRRLVTGRFSNSSKITAFLATMATLPVRIEHRPGSSMLLEDHASRNPPAPCQGPCQICKFVNDDSEMGDRLSIFRLDDDDDCPEMRSEEEKIPFLQLRTWKHEQMNCPVHSRLSALLKNGQEPERRKTGGVHTQVKHLHTLFKRNNLMVHKSGVIMIRSKEGFYNGFSISVPEPLFYGLCFSFHHKLNHPRKSQLVRFLSRYFYTPGLQNVVDQISDACLQCMSTIRLPKALLPETTTIPDGFGTSFSADVLERTSQSIFVCKEEMSQYVLARLVEDQTATSLRHAIIDTTSHLINMSGGKIRLDSAPGFQSLAKSQNNDPILQQLNLKIDLGHPLNKNQNPSGESTIGELKRELLNIVGKDDQVTISTLALATRNLNQRIRSNKKSAWEFLTSRDSMTSRPFLNDDEQELKDLKDRREKQHLANEKQKSKTRKRIDHVDYKQGDVVMFRDVDNYDAVRDTYIVVSDDGIDVTLRKFKKQMRLKTYVVKREQIILIFSPSTLKNSTNTKEPTPPHQVPLSTKPPTTKRKAALKSTMKTHQLAMDKVIAIKKKEAKDSDDEPPWAVLEFKPVDEQNNNLDEQVPNRSEDDSDSSGPFFGFDFSFNDADHNSDDDDQEDSDDKSNDDDSDDKDGLDEPLAHHNISATSGQSSSNPYVAHDTSHSLDWDNNSMTVNLSDPLDRTNLFSIPDDEFCRDVSYVLDEVFVPNLEEPESPPSPYLRFTRGTLRSGEFVRVNPHTRVSTMSSTNSDFLRNNPLRRPRPVVKTMRDDDISPITDGASAQPRRASRRRNVKAAYKKKHSQ